MRVRHDEVDHYASNSNFFQLKDDKESAKVRFMYRGIDDIAPFNVHVLKQKDNNGKDHNVYIDCLRDYRQPVDVCPFCREKVPTAIKLMVPLYNIDKGQAQLWERGKMFINKLTSLCSRYANSETELCSRVFTIERNGAKGYQKTVYEVYPEDRDDTTLEDLPDVPNPVGKLILEKSADDMEFYLENRYFPPDDDDDAGESDSESQVVRRRGQSSDSKSVTRRTPRGRDVY